jgi:subtilisin-like proprotein convertase family protein/subtilisin family serine protease
MERTLKVFCSGSEQDRLSDKIPVIERYTGFLLTRLLQEPADALARRYPVEDITDQYLLPAGRRHIDTEQPRLDSGGRMRAHPAYKGEGKLPPGMHHYLVQFLGPIKQEWLQGVEAAGGRLQAPHASFSYVVRADEACISRIAALPYVRWSGHLSHKDRIAASVLSGVKRKKDDVQGELPRTRVLPGMYAVTFFDSETQQQAEPQVQALGFEILRSDPDARVMILRVPAGKGGIKRIRDLAAVHGVRLIREHSLKRTSNDVAGRLMRTAIVTGASGLNLDGTGEVVAVCDTGLDTGDANSIHPDFSGRIHKMLSYPINSYYAPYIKNPGADDGAADLDSGHGTHVAGSVLGDGSSSHGLSGTEGPIRGLAHGARLVFQAIEQEMKWEDPSYYGSIGRYLLSGIPDDISTLFAEAYAHNARIHSNSWGGGDPGAYDAQSEQLDRFVWEHKDLCVLVAAGNDGTDQDGDGKINPMSVTSPATAKNCICVGASENERPNFNGEQYGLWWSSDYPVAPYRNAPMADNPEQVVAFSSRGPSEDGRIRPDLVAPGTFVLSTRSSRIAANNNAWAAFPGSRKYFHMGGTSMATPLAAGAATLVRQFLRRDKGIANPSAALIKAALIAGTKRLPDIGAAGAVCDNAQGFGRLDLDGALAPQALSTVEYIDVTQGLSTGEIWSRDISIQSNTFPLRVVMAYSDYPGEHLVNNLNIILTAPDGKRFVGNASADGSLIMDANNNVEMAQVTTPLPGSWHIEVVASNVPHPNQEFALVIVGALGEPDESGLIRAESTPGLAIPDQDPAGVYDAISLTQAGSIRTLAVEVDIGHTYIGDLKVDLISPAGTEITLHDRSGASKNELRRRYDVQSTGALAGLIGQSITGAWRLSVSDHAQIDEGNLRSWTLEIAPEVDEWEELKAAPGLRIPDDDAQGIYHTLEIDRAGTVRELELQVDITHTYIGDLRVELSVPSGGTVIIHDRTGGNRDNLIRTFATGTIPALSALIGESTKGEWTLSVSDHAGRDIGKLNAWALRVRF